MLHLVMLAGPASAHGVPTGGPPNWVSHVTSSPSDGLTWSVVGVDAALRLQNDSGDEVLVRGYGNEPYLRIGPDGVFENLRSTTRWLNLNRLGDLTRIKVPSDVGPDQPPSWQQIDEGSTWTWFDHRIHWIQINRLPPIVVADPDVSRVVAEWQVPAEIDGRSVGPVGELLWEPSPFPATGPYALVAAATALLMALVLLGRRFGQTRLAIAFVAVLVSAVGAWYEVGSLVELGNLVSSGGVIAAVIRTAALFLGSVAAIALVVRRHPAAPWFLLAVTIAVMATVGLRELEVLSLPVARGPLPTPFTRALIATALALPLAGLAATRDPQQQ